MPMSQLLLCDADCSHMIPSDYLNVLIAGAMHMAQAESLVGAILLEVWQQNVVKASIKTGIKRKLEQHTMHSKICCL